MSSWSCELVRRLLTLSSFLLLLCGCLKLLQTLFAPLFGHPFSGSSLFGALILLLIALLSFYGLIKHELAILYGVWLVCLMFSVLVFIVFVLIIFAATQDSLMSSFRKQNISLVSVITTITITQLVFIGQAVLLKIYIRQHSVIGVINVDDVT